MINQPIGSIKDICYKSQDDVFHFASSKNILFASAEIGRTKIVFDNGKVIYSIKPLSILTSHFLGNGYFFLNNRLWLKPSNIVTLIQKGSTNLLVMKNQISIEFQQMEVEELLSLFWIKKVRTL
ncbi:MAG: hypothetical protein P1U56_21290 [Saprospiraceae bacterium]|nr:hypothetical protein [Saprospiraceae bacterium]